MTLYVLDASAWLRLFLRDGPELAGLESSAAEVDMGRATFAAPELILVEAGHALARKEKRGLLRAEEVDALWIDMRRTPIEFVAIEPRIDEAIRLARDFKLSVYDALYLAVALHAGASLYTADDALAAAARRAGAAPG